MVGNENTMETRRVGYVQDERYAAGAGMRRSGFFQTGTGVRYVRRDCVSFAHVFPASKLDGALQVTHPTGFL